VDKDQVLTVFSFTSSVLFPTSQGNYFATAVGGVVASAPSGSDFILFDMQYYWDMAGTPLALYEPARIRLNTKMAVMRVDGYVFPQQAEEKSPPTTEDSLPQDNSDVDDGVDEVFAESY
jgi:hypothetical protein